MDSATIREASLKFLLPRGFQPADWLPLPEADATLRPLPEIAARLMALAAVFCWCSAPESAVASDRLKQGVARNRLTQAMSPEESEMLALSREEARETHANTIGWKLENLWPLAWVLGFDAEPTIEADQIDFTLARAIIFDFLDGLDGTVEALLHKTEPRSRDDVRALEDRFYCAHNAVRNAQLGRDTVPEGFHPVVHGGAVHERRHALSWCLSPGVAWDDTDLST